MNKPESIREKLNLMMQLSPPHEVKDKPPEIYPQLYFESALDSEEMEGKTSVSNSVPDESIIPSETSSNVIPSDKTMLIERTLRSGQSIRYDGHVVVMGDVNPGAEIVAGGHIIVFGALRGVAHAGAYGNKNAVVTACRLSPTQLRIANHITRAPDDEEVNPRQPEVAKISGDGVIIEKYYPGWDRGF